MDCVDHAAERPKNVFGEYPWEKKGLSASLAKSTVLLVACPEQKIGFGSAAIIALVAGRIVAASLFGHGMRRPIAGQGRNLPTLNQISCASMCWSHMRAPEGLGGAVRAGSHSGGCRDRRHDSEFGNRTLTKGQIRFSTVAPGQRAGFRFGQSRVLRHEG